MNGYGHIPIKLDSQKQIANWFDPRAVIILVGKEPGRTVLGSNITFGTQNLRHPGKLTNHSAFLSLSFAKCKAGIIIATFELVARANEMMCGERPAEGCHADVTGTLEGPVLRLDPEPRSPATFPQPCPGTNVKEQEAGVLRSDIMKCLGL